MRFLLLTAVSVAMASSADATIRCRTIEGRIYIGGEPPVGCRIEATYGTAGDTAASSSEDAPAAPGRLDAAEPPAVADSLEPAPGVSEPSSRGRRETEMRDARLAVPSRRQPAPEDERSEVQRALLSRRDEMESGIDQALLEIARLRRQIESFDPPPPSRPGASAEEVRARLRREAEYQRAVEPLRSESAALRARINGIRAEFAELTSRVATAHRGALPEWWPPELRCNRCP